MKKIIIGFILSLSFFCPLFSGEIAPFCQLSFFNKKSFHTIGTVFDYPFANENTNFFLRGMYGYSCTEGYPAGIDTEFHLGKQIKDKKSINRFGIGGEVISLANNSDAMCILNLSALYNLMIILEDKSYFPVYAGFFIKGGCGYSVSSKEQKLGPIVSVGISIGLLF